MRMGKRDFMIKMDTKFSRITMAKSPYMTRKDTKLSLIQRQDNIENSLPRV
jgi:hypothetical protein